MHTSVNLRLAAMKSVVGTASVAGDSFLSARQPFRYQPDDLKGDSEMNHHDLITGPRAKFSSQPRVEVPLPKPRPVERASIWIVQASAVRLASRA